MDRQVQTAYVLLHTGRRHAALRSHTWCLIQPELAKEAPQQEGATSAATPPDRVHSVLVRHALALCGILST